MLDPRALIQMKQMVLSGVFLGEEARTVMESDSGPVICAAFSMTVQEVFEAARAGKITPQDVLRALE